MRRDRCRWCGRPIRTDDNVRWVHVESQQTPCAHDPKKKAEP